MEAKEALILRVVKSNTGSVNCERENGGLLFGQGVWNLCSGDRLNAAIELEATIIWACEGASNVSGQCVSSMNTNDVKANLRKHTVALLELGHVAADFVHLTSNIRPEDGWPALNEETVVLNLPVHRVDCNVLVLYDNIIRAWRWKLRLGDLVCC